jgi:hypothetical protein
MTQQYYTRDQMIVQVLEELKVVAHGQAPAAEEYDVVDDNADIILADLAARQVVYIANATSIPIELFGNLTQAMARSLANHFSLTTDETDKMFLPENNPFSPESKLRAIRRSGNARTPQLPDYM